MVLLKKSFFPIFFLFVSLVWSQEIPPIQVFTPQEYNAEDQNWSIDQAENGFIYVANNKGLLEHNGSSWRLYNSPNEGILRSVNVVNNRIYSGGYMDFGYWIKDNFGKLNYTSLSENKAFSIKEDEEFWAIIDIEGYVLFQSLERIYIYNTQDESFQIINSETRLSKMFKVNETIYFQKENDGIYKIETGKEVLFINSSEIQNKELVGIYETENALLLQTKNHGFYAYVSGLISKWNITADRLLSSISVYSSFKLNDGSFLLGTISNGIIHLDKDGNIILRIDQKTGLTNNTVLSIKEDSFGNIWLGLDNGINTVNLNSPYRVYKDKQGVLGTVYASAKLDGYLYLGTNQGLFYKPLNSKTGFNFIKGTEGQVWCLLVFNGTLFCGHDNGTFLIDKEKTVSIIAKEKGTWSIKKIEGYPNLLLQGNYKGLSVLEKKDNTWIYRNKLEGFDMSSRFFELSDANKLIVSHEYKGVYQLVMDSNFMRVIDYKKIPIDKGIKSSLCKYNNDIIYNFKDGVFRYEETSNSLTRDSLLSALFGGEKYLSGKLISDKIGNRLWGFSKNEIIFIEPGKLSSEPLVNSVPISSELRKSKSGYENILFLEEDKYLVGTTEGYIIIDLNKLNLKSETIVLNTISYGTLHNDLTPIDLSNSTELKNKENNIEFNYSVANYNKLTSTLYQYRLLGIYDYWSNWTSKSKILFENLPHGDYVFEVRAKSDGVLSKNSISYSFSIDKPWYLKPLAIVLYIISGICVMFLIHFFNKRYYKKQKQKLIRDKERELELEQLENERQIIEFKNKNLRLDIDNKNRELGMATMNLVKRNELLNDIKVELAKSKTITDVKSVIRLINTNLNNTSDWKLFEEAFNNVDKDFMKRVKNLHPSITPNDLRLCAYLRLNLSSKEIAPLLNISHKSVEVKRYRLRKKMGLEHDQSLSNYIIEL
jgi:AraC family transcriptional regulator, chitin signaling transcriptional activator